MVFTIRILHVLHSMALGGAETMLMSLYRRIDRSKIQFDFMVHTQQKQAYDDEIISLGGRIFSVPRFTGSNISAYKRAWRQFFDRHRGEFAAVHGHNLGSAAIYLKIAKKYGLPAIAHSHSTHAAKKSFKDYYMHRLFTYPVRHRADYFFACSDAAGADRFGKNILKKANYKTFKNAIDAEKFAFDPIAREQKRKELNLGGDFTTGHIGNFRPPKNHDFLLDIFQEVCKKDARAKLLLAGDGELRPSMEQKAAKLGLAQNIIFLGPRRDIPELLSAMDAFLLPSLWEGLGIVLIEAQANGLHCFAADAVQKEAKITSLLEYIPLAAGPEFWAGKILEVRGQRSEVRGVGEIARAGYDIAETARWLEGFYLRLGAGG